jgi:prepilin-type N-terminal cleavage/methylation domain-containing protein
MEPRPKAIAGNCEGFSLIEAIVSLAILSLVAVSLSLALREGSDLRNRLSGAEVETGEISEVDATVRRLLERAWPGPNVPALTSNLFEGGPDRIIFLCDLPEQFGLGSLYRVSLSIRSSVGHTRLVIGVEPVHGPGKDEVREILLVEGPTAARFFFAKEIANGEVHWEQEWRNQTILPSLVRLELNSGTRTNEISRDVIVGLRLKQVPQ